MFDFKKHMEKMEKIEADFMTEQKKELAKRKRAVTISTTITVGKAIGTAFVTGVCTQVAINTLRNEDASSSVKVTAVSAAIIAGGLLGDNTYKACKAISSQSKVNNIHEGTLKLIDLVGKIKEKTDATESEESAIADTEVVEDANDKSNVISIQIAKDSPLSMYQHDDTLEAENNEKKDNDDAALDNLIESAVTTEITNDDVIVKKDSYNNKNKHR